MQQSVDPKKHPLTISFDQMPITEQHVHVEGTVDRVLLKKMAVRNGLEEIYQALEPSLYQFGVKNFLQFLTAYDLVSIFINTPADIEDMIFDYLGRCHRSGATHVDLTCSYGHAKTERNIFAPNKDLPEAQKTDFDKVVDSAIALTAKLPKKENLSFRQYIDAVTAGIDAARQRYGINANITMVLLRHEPVAEAEHLLDLIADYPHPDITAIGLAGDEEANPAQKFAACFTRAKSMGLHVTSHVGEHTKPEFIRKDLETLNLKRIGHGTTAIQDPQLMAVLKRLGHPAQYFLDLVKDQHIALADRAVELLTLLAKGEILDSDADQENLKAQLIAALNYVNPNASFSIAEYNQAMSYLFQPLTLEICPTSNLLLLPEMNTLQDHPLPKLIEAGVPVSISSDDPLFWSERVQGANFAPEDFKPSPFGCEVGAEWQKVKRVYDLRDEQMYQIYRDSVSSMFCSRVEKKMLLAKGALCYAFGNMHNSLETFNNQTFNALFLTYKRTPNLANLETFFNAIDSLHQETDLGSLYQCAQDLRSSHKACSKACDDYELDQIARAAKFDREYKQGLNETDKLKWALNK